MEKCHILKKSRSVLHWVIMLLLFIATIAGPLSISGCTATQPSQQLSLHFIDVGQGDSQLIITPQGNTILIDAGDSLQGERVAAYLVRHGVNRIDHLIITHPHGDHAGGILTILEQFHVSQVYLPPVIHTTQLYERILSHLDVHNIPTTLIRETSSILEEESLEVKLLSTGQDFGQNLNNWSLLTYITYFSQQFLFMGDAEIEAEEALMSYFHPSQLTATVLKAGHHGSNTSTSQQFLDIVSPDIVLISCGEDNPYSHPHPELMKRLEEHGAWIYRTDHQGSVVLHSDGIKVFSHQKPSNHQ